MKLASFVDYDLGVAGSSDDFRVRSAMQVQLSDENAAHQQSGSHPDRESGRKLIIEPERHAATMG